MAGLAQEEGRVIRRHDVVAAPREPLAAVAHDAGSAAVEILESDFAQADDDLRLDQLDFFD